MTDDISNNEIYDDSIEDINIIKHSASWTNSFQFSKENRNYTEQPYLQISKLLSLNENKTIEKDSNFNSNDDQQFLSSSNYDLNNLNSNNKNQNLYEINSLDKESNSIIEEMGQEKNINEDLESFLSIQQLKNEKSQKENISYLFDNNLSQSNSFLENPNRNFFTKIIDIDVIIDTNETYDRPWSDIINEIYLNCEKKNSSIQQISLGNQHTLCLSNEGKLFSFGWNFYSQCGIPPNKTEDKNSFDNLNYSNKNIKILNHIEKINEIQHPNKKKFTAVTCGEDHSIVIDEDGKIFGFGLNSNGQILVNNSKKFISKITNLKPFNNENITNIQSIKDISFALNEFGEAFIWPWKKGKNFQYYPLKLSFNYFSQNLNNKIFLKNEKIFSFSCGYNFAIFLTINGYLFSMGSNNKFGQLGHGDIIPKLKPTLIEFFLKSNEKILQISCGSNHVIAKNDKGKIYSWGLGKFGQLGLGQLYTESYIPHLIKFPENILSIYQISCGFRSSYFLTDKNTIFMCGYDGTFHNIFVPIEINLILKYPELKNNKNWICRILNCWNKSFSVFYITFLDCHLINIEDEKVNNVLNLISMKWIDQSFSNSIMEGMDNLNNTIDDNK